jgi:hypothetical protein
LGNGRLIITQLKQKNTGLYFPLYEVEELIHFPRVREWCKLPYPGHPKGCPNYGKRDKCPPKEKYITEIINIQKSMFFVHSEFDLTKHIKRMQLRHPEWSDRQLRCVLYWQNRSRKQMMERANVAARYLQAEVIIPMPEATGIQVYGTCKRSGLLLESIKNLKVCKHVAFIGWRP